MNVISILMMATCIITYLYNYIVLLASSAPMNMISMLYLTPISCWQELCGTANQIHRNTACWQEVKLAYNYSHPVCTPVPFSIPTSVWEGNIIGTGNRSRNGNRDWVGGYQWPHEYDLACGHHRSHEFCLFALLLP